MPGTLVVKDRRRCIGCLACRQACSRVRGEYSIANSAIGVKTSGGFTGEFIINICRGCKSPACLESCIHGALVIRDGGGVKFQKDKCVKCGACREACSISAIRIDSEGFPIICTHCGYCTKYCPHGCITMEEI